MTPVIYYEETMNNTASLAVSTYLSAVTDKFTLFPNLPLEIRRIIWNFALLQSPIMVLNYNLDTWWYSKWIKHRLAIPKAIKPKSNSLLLSCRESYTEIRHTSYRLGKGRIHCPKHTMVVYLKIQVAGYDIQNFETFSALQNQLEFPFQAMHGCSHECMEIEVDIDEGVLGISANALDPFGNAAVLELPKPKLFKTIFDCCPTVDKILVYGPEFNKKGFLQFIPGLSENSTSRVLWQRWN